MAPGLTGGSTRIADVDAEEAEKAENATLLGANEYTAARPVWFNISNQ